MTIRTIYHLLTVPFVLSVLNHGPIQTKKSRCRMISRREILAAGQHLLMSCFRCYEESRNRFLFCIHRGKVKATLAQFVREGGFIFFSIPFYRHFHPFSLALRTKPANRAASRGCWTPKPMAPALSGNRLYLTDDCRSPR